MFNSLLPNDRGDHRLPMQVLIGFLISEARSAGRLPMQACRYDIDVIHQRDCSYAIDGVCDCRAEFWAVYRPLEVSRG